MTETTPDKLRRLHRRFFTHLASSELTVAASEIEQLEVEVIRLKEENERVRAILGRQ